MRKVVRKITHNPVCDNHTCHNRAVYGIGKEGFPFTWANLCEDCFNHLVIEGLELIKAEADFDAISKQIEAENAEEKARIAEYQAKAEAKAKEIAAQEEADIARKEALKEMAEEGSETFGSEITMATLAKMDKTVAELQEQSKKEAEAKIIQEKAKKVLEKTNSVMTKKVSSKADDVYVCKYCSRTFKKPDELKEYRTHAMMCAREHKAKGDK